MNERQIELVARAICEACDENPSHAGDWRWQDYIKPAEAAIHVMHPLLGFNEPLADYQLRIYQDMPRLPQRQDALNDQLVDLKAVANRLGMYDAADFLRVL